MGTCCRCVVPKEPSTGRSQIRTGPVKEKPRPSPQGLKAVPTGGSLERTPQSQTQKAKEQTVELLPQLVL